MGRIYNATLAAIRAADHLTDIDKGAVAMVKYLAKKVDTEDELRDLVIANLGEGEKPPPLDNVSVPTYLKYCDALGLTPAGRKALALRKEGESAKAGKLTSLRGGKTAAAG